MTSIFSKILLTYVKVERYLKKQKNILLIYSEPGMVNSTLTTSIRLFALTGSTALLNSTTSHGRSFLSILGKIHLDPLIRLCFLFYMRRVDINFLFVLIQYHFLPCEIWTWVHEIKRGDRKFFDQEIKLFFHFS